MTRIFTLVAQSLLVAVFVHAPARSYGNADTASGGGTTFERGLSAFDQAKTPEDFLRAARLFQEVLDAGTVHAAVFYNQGNAFLRAGEYGRAIACYRQAERYMPRDARLAANLQYAREKAGVSVPTPGTWDRLCFWYGWVGYQETFLAMGTFGTLAFALGMIPVIWPSRRLPGKFAFASLAFAVLFGLLGATMWYDHDHVTHGVLTAEEVTARKGNGDGYQPVFKNPLSQGTEFTLVERRGDWLLVRLPDGHDAWIKESAAVLY